MEHDEVHCSASDHIDLWWPARRSLGARKLPLGRNVVSDGSWIAYRTDGYSQAAVVFGPRDGDLETVPAYYLDGRRPMSPSGDVYVVTPARDVYQVGRHARWASARPVCAGCDFVNFDSDGRRLVVRNPVDAGLVVAKFRVVDARSRGTLMSSEQVPFQMSARFLDDATVEIHDAEDNESMIWDLRTGGYYPGGFSSEHCYLQLLINHIGLVCEGNCSRSFDGRAATDLLGVERDGRYVLLESFPRQSRPECTGDALRLVAGTGRGEVPLLQGSRAPFAWLDRHTLLHAQGTAFVATDLNEVTRPTEIGHDVSSVAVDAPHRRVYYTVTGDGSRGGLYVLDP